MVSYEALKELGLGTSFVFVIKERGILLSVCLVEENSLHERANRLVGVGFTNPVDSYM